MILRSSVLLSFCCGVGIIFCLAELPSQLMLVIAGLIAVWVLPWRLLHCLSAFLVGLIWSCIVVEKQLATKLPHEFDGQTFWIQGYVSTLPEFTNGQLKFRLRVHCISRDEIIAKHCSQNVSESKLQKIHTISLGWRHPHVSLHPGEVWLIKAKLKRPRSFANPGSQDYALWMLQQGINASGYVKTAVLIDGRQSSFAVNSIREKLRQTILAKTDNFKQSAILLGLVLGDRSGFDAKIWDVFIQTGTIHLITISGLHIGVFAIASMAMLNFLGRFITILNVWPRQKLAVVIGIISAFFYSLLAGFSLPTVRALIMLFLVIFAFLFERKVKSQRIFWLTVAFVLLVDPLSVVSRSFWLSFSAVGLLIFFLHKPDKMNKCRYFFHVQLSMFVGFSAILLCLFNQAPLMAFLANTVAIPVVSFIVIPLDLCGAILLFFIEPLGVILLKMSDYLTNYLFFFLEALREINSNLNPAHFKYQHVWFIVGLSLIIFTWCQWITKRLLVAVILLLATFLQSPSRLVEGAFTLTVLDVGQGLAIVVKTQHHVLVYDAGAKIGQFDLGQIVVVPYLRSEEIDFIDKLIVSHSDNDHAGGLSAILSAFPVASLVFDAPQGLAFSETGCRAGQHWIWDEVQFTVIHPHELGMKTNNNSCVLKIENAAHAVLIPGDIEKNVEYDLVKNFSSELSADVLVAPHHGSLTSSSWPFLRAVSPKMIVVSAGHNNRFNHPHPTILKRYESLGIAWLNTAESGALHYQFGKHANDVELKQFRVDHPKFWQ